MSWKYIKTCNDVPEFMQAMKDFNPNNPSNTSKLYISAATKELAELFRQEYELYTTTTFTIRRTSGSYCKAPKFIPLPNVRWSFHVSDVPLCDIGLPFCVIGRRLLECQHGVDWGIKKKVTRIPQAVSDDAPASKSRKLIPTIKMNCSARIHFLEIITFPDHKIDPISHTHDRRTKRLEIINILKEDKLTGMVQVIISFSSIGAHRNHPTGEAAKCMQPLDRKVRRKIKELVQQDPTLTPKTVASEIEKFAHQLQIVNNVGNETSTKRFYPSTKDIQNHVFLAKRALRLKTNEAVIKNMIVDGSDASPMQSADDLSNDLSVEVATLNSELNGLTDSPTTDQEMNLSIQEIIHSPPLQVTLHYVSEPEKVPSQMSSEASSCERTTSPVPSVPSVLQPESTPSVLQPDSTPSVLQPDSTPSVLQPESTRSVLQPESTPSVLQPESTRSVLQPDSTPSVLQPESSPSVLQPESTRSVLQPESSPSVLQPESTRSVLQPESTPIHRVTNVTGDSSIVNEEYDDAYHFAMSLVPRLRALRGKQLYLARIRIDTVLYEIGDEPSDG